MGECASASQKIALLATLYRFQSWPSPVGWHVPSASASRNSPPHPFLRLPPSYDTAQAGGLWLFWVHGLKGPGGVYRVDIQALAEGAGWRIAVAADGGPLSGLEEWVAERLRRMPATPLSFVRKLEREKGIRLSLRTIEREVRHLRRELDAASKKRDCLD